MYSIVIFTLDPTGKLTIPVTTQGTTDATVKLASDIVKQHYNLDLENLILDYEVQDLGL
jgi:hypothetical protein